MAVNKGANFVLTAQNKGGAAMKQFQGQLQGIKGATAQMAPVGRSWNKGLSENRRAIQQLGFQMTDFSVQIAGGQNAMLAFIQQGGQMLQVFGPAGAILATLLTVFGTLALVIGKSGKSLSDMTPIFGVLTDELQFLAAAFRFVTDIMIDGINLILNNLDTLLIAAGIVAGYFAGGWVIALVSATYAASTLAFMITIVGVRAGIAGALVNLLNVQFLLIAGVIGIAVGAFAIFGSSVGMITTAVGALILALVFLRGTLMTLLPYALVALLAVVIQKFVALRQAGVSWGEILNRLWNLAKAVFAGIGAIIMTIGPTMSAAANDMAAWFIGALQNMLYAFQDFTQSVADGLNGLFGTSLQGADFTGITGELDRTRGEFKDAGTRAANEVHNTMTHAFDGVKTAWADLNKGIKDNPIDVRDWFGGGEDDKKGGGGAAKKVKEEVDKIKKIFEDLKSTISDSMMTAFKGVVMGTKSLKDAALDMLTSILDKVIEIMMQPIFDSIAGGLAGNIMGALGFPSFAGGGNTGNGSRSGGLDGKGGFMALLHPKETVIDHARGQSAGGGSQVIELRITEGSTFGARVEAIANDSAVKITKASLQEYDDRVLPVSVRRVSANPRSR